MSFERRAAALQRRLVCRHLGMAFGAGDPSPFERLFLVQDFLFVERSGDNRRRATILQPPHAIIG